MNKDRLRAVRDAIVATPDKLDMTSWFERHGRLANIDEDSPEMAEIVEKITTERRPICGTTACLAGWTVLMFGTREDIRGCVTDRQSWGRTAAALLDMPFPRAEALFMSTNHAVLEHVDSLLLGS